MYVLRLSGRKALLAKERKGIYIHKFLEIGPLKNKAE